MVLSIGRVAKSIGGAINRGAHAVGRGIDKAAHHIANTAAQYAPQLQKAASTAADFLESDTGRGLTDTASSLAEGVLPGAIGKTVGKGIRGAAGVARAAAGALSKTDVVGKIANQNLGKRIRGAGASVSSAITGAGSAAERRLSSATNAFMSNAAGGGRANVPGRGGVGVDIGRAAKRLATGLSMPR